MHCRERKIERERERESARSYIMPPSRYHGCFCRSLLLLLLLCLATTSSSVDAARPSRIDRLRHGWTRRLLSYWKGEHEGTSSLVFRAAQSPDPTSRLILQNFTLSYTAVSSPRSSSSSRHYQQQRQRRQRRRLEDNNNNDFYNYNGDDDQVNNNNNNDDDEQTNMADEKCSEFLVSFLEGTTDAHDTCEGIMNAYTAADCSDSDDAYREWNDMDDYFSEFAEHECCQALIAHHSEYCEGEKLLSNFHLFVAASVLLLCECAKVLIGRLHLRFLPDAGVCILVGTLCGLLPHILPFANIDDISFDDELFLTVLLPPIIFEASLSVSKYEFKRRRGAIFMFAVLGTVISTFSTGLFVHYGSKMSHATTFPMLDSLTFGALISSIDPVAILSVLTSLNLDQKDTIFILVFGESLLNDGIAITVFQTLVDRFDGKTNDGSTSMDEVFDALASFLITMFGSMAVGLACGCGAWIYFKYLDKNLPPVMEVGSFFLWAGIPYYICDGVGWSGIVSIVVVGFFMDIYIAGPKDPSHGKKEHSDSSTATPPPPTRHGMVNVTDVSHYFPMENDLSPHMLGRGATPHAFNHGIGRANSFDSSARSIGPLPSTERIHMSATADKHVRFVAHLTSQLAENAIFAYLGLFLFSNNYDWDPTLVSIAIFSCVTSRTLMVVIVSWVLCRIYRFRGMRPSGQSSSKSSRTAAAIQNPRTQAVLVMAGLRGAVSLALVENVPIYNTVTGEGCEFKQVMKGMTSGAILFTTFVFGGGAYYILPHLGITPDLHTTSNDSVSTAPPPDTSGGPLVVPIDSPAQQGPIRPTHAIV